MRKDTAADRLKKMMEEMGVQVDHIDTAVYSDKPKSKVTYDVAVEEEEIVRFREAEGVYYFLRAPELFSKRTCANCSTPFHVSRKTVAHCSHECVRESLRKMGVEWSRWDNLEGLVNDPSVYGGNEPLIIRNAERILKVLNRPDPTE